MSEETVYWKSEDYEPTWDDFFQEWEAGNVEWIEEWFGELDNNGELEYPQNLFIKAVSEGRTSLAEKLTDYIEEGEEFYDMIMDFCAGDLEVMTLIIENSRWYKCDAVAEIYEGLRNRETLRKQAEEAESQAETLEERVEELEEEVERLKAILDENGISY